MVTGGVWGASDFEFDAPTDRESQEEESALVVASTQMMQSVEAARLPLEVAQTDPDEVVQGRIDPAKEAVWVEGARVRLSGEIVPDTSVFVALKARGLDDLAIQAVVDATSEEFNFRHARPGDVWEARVNATGEIETFRYKTSPEDVWETRRQSSGTYVCAKVEVPIEIKQDLIGGVVTSSLWQSMEDAGIDAQIASGFLDLFSHEVDFTERTRPGDRFGVVFERLYVEGEELRTGRILAARYIPQEGEPLEAYLYEADGEEGYFDQKGESLESAFLRAPLSNVRITSKFGKRFHPVLKRWKLHRGVDYGASTGTPVMSVADGKVTFAGWKGANGKLVSVKHENGYVSHYAHLSHIPRHIKRGKKVTKKTTIGRVGSTGRSTGPHLHFGMSKNGKFVDPLKVDIMRAPPLDESDRLAFAQEISESRGRQLDKAMGRIEPELSHAHNTYGYDE